MSRTKERDTLEQHRRLDVRKLHKAGVLQPGYSGGWEWWRDGERTASIGLAMHDANTLHLHYSLTRHGKTEQLDYGVPITSTPCHLGGQRPWFLCPCCGRRVAVLYLIRYFACRHCQRLNYASQQTSKRDLACDQSWKLRRALGCNLGFLDLPAEFVPRPKGMHRRTFARKVARLQQLDAQALASIGAMLARLGSSIERVQQRLGL